MFRAKRFGVLAWAVALTLVPGAAAEPSIWDLAREPGLSRQRQTLTSLELFFLGLADAWDQHVVQKITVEYPRAAPFPDPRIEVLLAELRLEMASGAEHVVRRRLELTLARAPEGPLAPRGWLLLGQLAARERDFDAAAAAYGRCLQRALDPELRVRAHLGRAQLAAAQRNLVGALAHYRLALNAEPTPSYVALIYYGMGAAEARRDNLRRGLEHIRAAEQIRVRSTAFNVRTALDLPAASFVPAFDEYYVRALTKLAEAESAESEQHLTSIREARKYLKRYLKEARAADDPWVEQGAALLLLLEERVAAAEREAQPQP